MKSAVTLTDAAKRKITEICQRQNLHAIALSVKGGGCAGFEYDWYTVRNSNDLHPADIVVEEDNAVFVLERTALMFILGSTIDYQETLTRSGFEVINPNAKSSCGCGVSVNFDLEKISN